MTTKKEFEESIGNIRGYIEKLETELAEKQKELENLQQDTSNLRKEKMSASEKLAEIEREMAELSSVYEELKTRKDIEIDLQEVMRLYVILTEQVLDGNAHMRILTLLHGKKDTMSRKELAKASGIQPAATLKAIFDLRNNGLLTYDEEKDKAKLVRRLFD